MFFREINNKDVPLVGGKNASLGEMFSSLGKEGVRVPDGFAITAWAYRYFIDKAEIGREIKNILSDLNTHNMANLRSRGRKVRQLILKSSLPKELEREVIEAYHKLVGNREAGVAVRSSATAEDLPDASFAGQQETFLNVRGEADLLLAVKKCMASLFTDRAISYREDKHFNHFKVALSVAVQLMVRADKASSGVMFTLDTESGFRDVVLINSIYGLGENIVQGRVSPDEFLVFKPLLAKGFKSLIVKELGTKRLRMVYDKGTQVKNVKVRLKDAFKYSISDSEALELARWGMKIEEHYKKPMDIEWAKDGVDGKLYIVQARPETVRSQDDAGILEEYELVNKSPRKIVSGVSVGKKIGAGKARVILDIKEINKFKVGEVLVTDMTNPDWEPIMKKAAGIVTDSGGRTCFSGETKILTNRGFMSMAEINKLDKIKGLKTVSLNKDSYKLEWKEITDTMKRKSRVFKVDVSQTGLMKENFLNLTPDHKFLTFTNRVLIEEEIQNILEDKQSVLVADNLPLDKRERKMDKKLAYLLGAILTDGSIYLSRTHGEVQLIQKPTKDKQEFINTVVKYFKDLFDKDLGISKKNNSGGQIRGRQIKGEANAYRCYSKEVATKFKKWKDNLVELFLYADREACLNFLGGVLDGDGSQSKDGSRLHIYCSNEDLLQAIVICCLKLNIVPQVAFNRNIYNIQIVEKIDDILKYSKRLNKTGQRKAMGTRFFNAKQLLFDIADQVNFKGRIKRYIKGNFLIDAEKIRNNVLPMLKGGLKNDILRIINSDFRMLRVNRFKGGLKNKDVYNISVEDNHNYVVFTSRYTPVIVNNCHAAIVSRELGIPSVVGTGVGSKLIKTGDKITIDCSQGEKGHIYSGLAEYRVKKTKIKKMPKVKTQVMMNIGEPSQAFMQAQIPNFGVGLARLEFIINEYIKTHPLALLAYDKGGKGKVYEKIAGIIKQAGYQKGREFFVGQLAEGIARIGAAFYPKDVIVRMSDFKTNEYSHLIGGSDFEPAEQNPMLGWRGASRYYDPKFKPAFEMECEAFRKAREEMGLDNIKIMVPFVRTLDEAKKVLKILSENGLKRGKKGLEIYMMVEIPSNIILASDFAKLFDGFSIGSNDLTQLTLGVDRDSELVSHVYDERNEAVKELIRRVIEVAKKSKTKIGICGQGPSDFPDFASFLVKEGIDSMSLNPDTVVKTMLSLGKKKR